MSERKSSILHPRSNFTKNPCYTFHHSAPVTTLRRDERIITTRRSMRFRAKIPDTRHAALQSLLEVPSSSKWHHPSSQSYPRPTTKLIQSFERHSVFIGCAPPLRIAEPHGEGRRASEGRKGITYPTLSRGSCREKRLNAYSRKEPPRMLQDGSQKPHCHDRPHITPSTIPDLLIREFLAFTLVSIRS
ncbi:hypothetical protein WG66_013083 [Moniliophthora roreri]|nr:hypothetical protein WG66_013083 [Moniliophthora roreri]